MNDPNIAVTTVEDTPDKPMVQGYGEQPLLELTPGVVACGYCGYTKFRRSRLRFHDLRELILLRYPVRCTRCAQRQYNDYAVGFLAIPPKQHGPKLARGTDTWASWTETHGDKAARPMSTAMEPRARRLDPLVSTRQPQRPAPPARTPSRSSDDSIW